MQTYARRNLTLLSAKCVMMVLSSVHLLFQFLEGFVVVLIFMGNKNINSLSPE